MSKLKGYKFSNFKTDKDLEENGKWTEYSAGFKVKVARFSNKKHKELYRELSKSDLRSIGTEEAKDEEVRVILRKTMSQFILMDFEGLIDDNEKTIKHSVQQAYEMLHENDFFDEILKLSMERDLFKKKQNLKSVGNSESS